jgi:hypothetical protein
MRISFDIDDTLICYQPGAQYEPNRVPRILRYWFREPLRLGTINLMEGLTQQGHSIWIYTTSYRTPWLLRLWFRLYGIRIGQIINQRRHEQIVKPDGFRRWPSKYPPAFGIDLHVDDSEGVGMEGREHGFRAVVVSPEDPLWTERVLKAVCLRECD